MAHSNSVSKAIQAALNDIDLLRPLVDAPDKTAVNNILLDYQENKEKLGLEEPYLEEFWDSLKHGVMTMDARTLVDYFYSLRPERAVRIAKGRREEWTP